MVDQLEIEVGQSIEPQAQRLSASNRDSIKLMEPIVYFLRCKRREPLLRLHSAREVALFEHLSARRVAYAALRL